MLLSVITVVVSFILYQTLKGTEYLWRSVVLALFIGGFIFIYPFYFMSSTDYELLSHYGYDAFINFIDIFYLYEFSIWVSSLGKALLGYSAFCLVHSSLDSMKIK